MKLKGFTLFELLLVMSIGLFFLTALVPSYRHFVFHNKVAAVVNQLSLAIHSARQQAISNNQIVELCGSGDHSRCDGNWQNSQILVLAESQKVLQVFSLLGQGERLWWQSSLGDNNALKLAPTGFTQGQRGSFYYCSADGNYGAKVIVTDSGRVRVETDSQEVREACGGALAS